MPLVHVSYLWRASRGIIYAGRIQRDVCDELFCACDLGRALDALETSLSCRSRRYRCGDSGCACVYAVAVLHTSPTDRAYSKFVLEDSASALLTALQTGAVSSSTTLTEDLESEKRSNRRDCTSLVSV